MYRPMSEGSPLTVSDHKHESVHEEHPSRWAVYTELISFSHTIFALPFALAGMVLAADGLPGVTTIILILVAMVAARTGAMSVNRFADAGFDADNPRTASRPIPRGDVSRVQAATLALASFAVLGLAAWGLNPLCLKLYPVALVALIGYSYTKRVTPYTHVVLGLALGAAPVGAWIAVRGTLDPEIIVLGAAVLLWVGGFDILYSLQDKDVDEKVGLKSIPVRFGVLKSIMISRAAHIGTVVLLFVFGALLGLGKFYFVGALGVAAILAYEHFLVRGGRLEKINKAFFDLNGYVSILFFVCVLVDVLAS